MLPTFGRNVIVKVLVQIFFATLFFSAKGKFHGNQVWRIVPRNDEQLKFLHQLSSTPHYKVDTWKHPTLVDIPADYHIPVEELSRFKRSLSSHDISYDVMIANVQNLVDDQYNNEAGSTPAASGISGFNYSLYHTAEEINGWMDLAQTTYDYVTKFQIGVTYQGRPIYALKISKSNLVRPAIYIDALIHCREWIATGSLLYVLKELLTNSSYSSLIEDLDWYVVPMINVDGYLYTWDPSGNRLWRQTRSAQAILTCFGADANRNFDDHWSGPGSSEEPCSSLYHGPMAESESETRHIARFISGHNDTIKAVVSLHSYAQVILYPYNYQLKQYPPNNNEQNKTAEEMSKAMFAIHNVSYNYGPGAETLSVSTGVTTDWTQAKADIDINYTIELRDTGQYGFLLPPDQIIPTGEELLAGIEVLAKHIIESELSTPSP
ncbi:carboxypeptidase B-like [Clavelina lepadiformis]|uniref:carboxypeptidase B-like n=1 Tax=Clavelina lepadiformis TaxID=159417 RepID=UPI004040F8CD